MRHRARAGPAGLRDLHLRLHRTTEGRRGRARQRTQPLRQLAGPHGLPARRGRFRLVQHRLRRLGARTAAAADHRRCAAHRLRGAARRPGSADGLDARARHRAGLPAARVREVDRRGPRPAAARAVAADPAHRGRVAHRVRAASADTASAGPEDLLRLRSHRGHAVQHRLLPAPPAGAAVPDRASAGQHPSVRARFPHAAGPARCGRRGLPRRSLSRPWLPQPPRPDRGALPARPLRARRTRLPHRRPGPAPAGRPGPLRRARRRPGQTAWVPDRAAWRSRRR